MEKAGLKQCPSCKKGVVPMLSECPFCRIVFEKVRLQPRQTGITGRVSLDADLNHIYHLWDELIRDFKNSKKHELFASYGIQKKIIPELVSRYEWVLQNHADFDEIDRFFARRKVQELSRPQKNLVPSYIDIEKTDSYQNNRGLGVFIFLMAIVTVILGVPILVMFDVKYMVFVVPLLLIIFLLRLFIFIGRKKRIDTYLSLFFINKKGD